MVIKEDYGSDHDLFHAIAWSAWGRLRKPLFRIP